MQILKDIVRSLPFVNRLAKRYYDDKNERKTDRKIKDFFSGNGLAYTESVPEKFKIGHEPTIRCNLRCSMCYQGQTRALRRSELTSEEAQAMYVRLKGKTGSIKLVGGEPFMRTDIIDLISFWDKEGVDITLQTNCTLLSEERIRKLSEYPGIKDIATSLDGPREVHDGVRGVPGTFDRLENAIRLIRKTAPKIRISVFATLLPYYNLDSLKDLVDTSVELGLGTINISFEQVYRPVTVENTKKIFEQFFGWKEGEYQLNTQTREDLFPAGLNCAGLRAKLDSVREYGFKKGCFVNYNPYNFYENLDVYLGEKPARAVCRKLLNPELRINQRGEVIWCDVIEKSFGNLLEQTPEEIWLSKDYQDFRKYLFVHNLPICLRCCKAHYV